ncbi:MAG: acyl-CoA dehydrogenase family protein, partial [Dehalococcoidia bacterium]|nr:acyl-CoA dehydrogenase family protein [Dehalococcoidia bacterium]
GGGWPKVKQALFNEIAAYRRIRGTGNANLGASTVGPTIMIYGTKEQKDFFLPRIARGEITWSQGFSEPNAGSDLAALETRAVADGDDFVINGAKIWNHSQHADYLFLLARTDRDAPKHKGITQFLIPLKEGIEGITIQPIRDAYGAERWTLLTLEDVRVPRSMVLGEVNRGWYQTTTSLDFERSQMAWVGQSRRFLEQIMAYAQTTTRNGRRIIDDPFLRDRIGALRVQLEAARWLGYRIAYLQDQGLVPNVEASMSKVLATETQQKIQRLGMDVVGHLGHLSAGSPYAELDGLFDEEYWNAPGTTLAGGASEIQRNIIATRGLGLPRGA